MTVSWPTVTREAIESRWRGLTAAEGTIVAQRIEDAEAELQYQLRLRGFASPPVDDAAWDTIYEATVAEMVRRYLLNPDGWLQESEAIDDYRRDRRRDSAVSSGLLYVTDAEVSKLLPRRRRGAFTIRLGTS